jgi:hypothetical protein
MQENIRAAVNLMAKDVSMAGAGLPSGGLALPNGGAATASLFGCDSGRCYLANNTYPSGTIGSGASTTTVNNYMYGLIPGSNNGMETGGPTTIAASAVNGAPDAITVIYADYSFPLSQYTVTIPTSTGNSITVTPPGPAPFPQILDPTGIKVGDLILLSANGNYAVGEVTSITNAGGTIGFANADPLNINQSGAANNRIGSLFGGANPKAYRIYAVTYFFEVPAGQLPRLMRQVNGQKPVPVADNIIDLAITYDMCDNTNTGGGGPITCAGVANPIASGFSPNQIKKVNIVVTGQALVANGKNSQSLALATSVSTRNLVFKDRYN